MLRRITLFALLLTAGLAHALETPQLSLSTQYNPDLDCVQVQLSWPSVSGAEYYELYHRDPRNAAWQTDSLLTTTTNCEYSLRVPMLQVGRVRPNVARLFSVRAVTTVEEMPLVLVPAGEFVMGQVGVAEPEHTVTLSHDFYLGQYEVSNQEYVEALQWAYDQGLVTASSSSVQAYGLELLDLDDIDCEISYSGSQFSVDAGSEQHPVIEVTWYGAACYCDWRSLREGLPAFYQGNWNIDASHDPYMAQGYRLPTEAEWEYAAQWDDERSYPWGNESPSCERQNYNNCVGWTTPVGSYPATGRGFYDLAGNVWEWCGDWYGDYSSSTQTNPYGNASGTARALRGGDWNDNASYARCAYRDNETPTSAYSDCGFRCVRTVD